MCDSSILIYVKSCKGIIKVGVLDIFLNKY